jgi:hypothetical protein
VSAPSMFSAPQLGQMTMLVTSATVFILRGTAWAAA